MAGRWFEASYHPDAFTRFFASKRGPVTWGVIRSLEKCPVAANGGAGRRLKPLWRFQPRDLRGAELQGGSDETAVTPQGTCTGPLNIDSIMDPIPNGGTASVTQLMSSDIMGTL
ncbi:uncharacterized protein Triagg1_7215 [Trichoderma aggressivum f. europaeum]|uniref:Uncharacterized protein n=1 Tax=Trichoderma aggressivum f. europaeum TaxID=173218 RepID=A0AAE1IBY3_9HYPO|nr:hypothetical protein Triagg1_7215 [Trichoderma aggressivum f. europaeum]